MPRTRVPYPPEFREQAVRLVRESGKTMTAIAQELGVSLESLRTWVRRQEIEEGKREGLKAAERREILRKAVAFFVQETQRGR